MNLVFGSHENEEKYIENKQYSTISVCSSFNSISSIIGSVTSFITEYFKSKFPEGFFKDTYISTTMAASAIKKDYFEVKKRPYLFVQPQFDLSPGIMNELPMLFTDTSWVYLRELRKNYKLIFEDSETGIRIFNAVKRTKINFRFGIKVSTELQGWNTISYIDQNFQTNGYFYLNRVFLNSTVPPFIIKNIANRKGWDLNEALDREQMQQYLLKYSLNGIEENTDLSTGNPAYMYKYPCNILINYPDMSNSNKSMRNNVSQNSIVEYNISAELWTPSTFIMEMDNIERFKNIPLENPKNYDDGKYHFSLVMNMDYIPYNKEEKVLLMKRNFIPEVNLEYDTIDLKGVLPFNVERAIPVLNKYHIKLSEVFLIDLYINGRIVFKENYTVDEKELILKTFNPMRNTSYTCVMYADMNILNKIDLLLNDNSKEAQKELDIFMKSLQKKNK